MRAAIVTTLAAGLWASAAHAEPAGGGEPAPWAALPAPFATEITATSGVDEGLFLLFSGRASLYLEASGPPRLAGSARYPAAVDAAVAWDAERTVLFVGDRVIVAGPEEDDTSLPLGDLGVPSDWTRVDAAVRYSPEHWLLFFGDQALIYEIPTDEAPGRPVELIRLAAWWPPETKAEDWTNGIDAAAHVAAGTIALFRGPEVRVLDLSTGALSAPVPYAGKGASR